MLSVRPSKRPLFDHFWATFWQFSTFEHRNSPKLFFITNINMLVNVCAMTTGNKVVSHAGLPVWTFEFYLKMPILRKIQSIHEYIHHSWILVRQSIHIMNTQPPRVFISWILSVQSIHTHIIPFMNRPGQRPKGRAARSLPRLQGTSILMDQPWERAAAISTPSAQVPNGP